MNLKELYHLSVAEHSLKKTMENNTVNHFKVTEKNRYIQNYKLLNTEFTVYSRLTGKQISNYCTCKLSMP